MTLYNIKACLAFILIGRCGSLMLCEPKAAGYLLKVTCQQFWFIARHELIEAAAAHLCRSGDPVAQHCLHCCLNLKAFMWLDRHTPACLIEWLWNDERRCLTCVEYSWDCLAAAFD